VTYLWLLTLGLGAGVLSGLFGIGGGIVIVPALVLGFKLSQTSANGTSLLAFLLPVGLLGAINYYRAGRIDIVSAKWALTIAFGIFLGTFLGSRLALSLPEAHLRRAFAVLLVAVAIRLWFSTK